jgi:hypothetical protein
LVRSTCLGFSFTGSSLTSFFKKIF